MVTRCTESTALSIFVSLLGDDEIADMQFRFYFDIRCHELKSMVTRCTEPPALNVMVSLLDNDQVADA